MLRRFKSLANSPEVSASINIPFYIVAGLLGSERIESILDGRLAGTTGGHIGVARASLSRSLAAILGGRFVTGIDQVLNISAYVLNCILQSTKEL